VAVQAGRVVKRAAALFIEKRKLCCARRPAEAVVRPSETSSANDSAPRVWFQNAAALASSFSNLDQMTFQAIAASSSQRRSILFRLRRSLLAAPPTLVGEHGSAAIFVEYRIGKPLGGRCQVPPAYDATSNAGNIITAADEAGLIGDVEFGRCALSPGISSALRRLSTN